MSRLVFALLLMSASFAHAQSCVDLFRPQTLEQLDARVRGQLLGGRSVNDVRSEMGLIRKWKVALLQRKLERGDVSNVIEDLHLIFIEPRMTSLDIVTYLRDGDRRRRNWMEREELRQGLSGLIDEGLLEKAELSLFSRLPRSLPFLRDREIPRDLLMDALDHGVARIEKIYADQARVDLMRAMQPYVNALALALLGYAVQQYRERQAGAEMVSQVQDTEQSLDAVILELKRQRK